MGMRFTTKDVLRFEEFIRQDASGHWFWNGAFSGNGTPALSLQGKVVSALRLSYAIYREPLQKDLKVVTTCGLLSCINPKHLKAATAQEIFSSMKLTCRRGHPSLPETVRINKNGSRTCKICEREKRAMRRAIVLREQAPHSELEETA